MVKLYDRFLQNFLLGGLFFWGDGHPGDQLLMFPKYQEMGFC